MNKRGQGIQFNWIFILIAGALLLGSLLVFGVKYVALQGSRGNAELGRSLDQVFYNTKSTTQFKDFSISSSFDINFECNETIINSEYRQPNDYVLFGSDSEDVNELIIWSREFKAPFLIDNIVYVFDPEKKIYIDDSRLKGELETIGVDVVSNPNEADIVVYVDSSVVGKITVNNQVFDYYDEALIYGAIVSDFETYNCVKDKLEKKWKNLLEIYYLKTQNLVGGCGEVRNTLKDKLYFAFNNIPPNDDLINEISDLNRDLANLGCEVIF